MERWFSGQEYLLLLQRIVVHAQHQYGSAQWSETLVPGVLVPSSDLPKQQVYVGDIYTHVANAQTHKLKTKQIYFKSSVKSFKYQYLPSLNLLTNNN